jgi:CheY-like chemotaxis protein
MSELPTILITEDDDGHAFLMEEALRSGGINAPFRRFFDGQEILDFFFAEEEGGFKSDTSYLLLLDIRLPKVDGVSVLKQIKGNGRFHKMPVIMVTTSEDPDEVERCHALGCNAFIQKPMSYPSFSEVMTKLGHFAGLLELPHFSKEH